MSTEKKMWGTIEGLESSYDSHGMGDPKTGTFVDPPLVGERFRLVGNPKGWETIVTGTVQSVKHFDDGARVGFRTNRTTYMLYLLPAPPEGARGQDL